MERARRIWEDERLPALSPKTPWFGYPLGPWPAEWEEEADVAVKGRYESSASSALATARFVVSRPSVYRPYTSPRIFRASLRTPRRPRSRPRLVAARNSQAWAPCCRAIASASRNEPSAVA